MAKTEFDRAYEQAVKEFGGSPAWTKPLKALLPLLVLADFGLMTQTMMEFLDTNDPLVPAVIAAATSIGLAVLMWFAGGLAANCRDREWLRSHKGTPLLVALMIAVGAVVIALAAWARVVAESGSATALGLNAVQIDPPVMAAILTALMVVSSVVSFCLHFVSKSDQARADINAAENVAFLAWLRGEIERLRAREEEVEDYAHDLKHSIHNQITQQVINRSASLCVEMAVDPADQGAILAGLRDIMEGNAGGTAGTTGSTATAGTTASAGTTLRMPAHFMPSEGVA